MLEAFGILFVGQLGLFEANGDGGFGDSGPVAVAAGEVGEGDLDDGVEVLEGE